MEKFQYDPIVGSEVMFVSIKLYIREREKAQNQLIIAQVCMDHIN